MKPKAILTFDLEFWHNSQWLKKYLPPDRNSLADYTQESTRSLLNLLEKYQVQATFFVLGQLAEKYPDLVKIIAQAGHQIASHGYSHQSLQELDENSFEKEIRLTNQLLERITGSTVKGFRAPNFSLNQQTKWALKILEKYNFQYDSSLFPLRTPLYGAKQTPLAIHQISDGLIEVPLAIYQLGLFKWPVAGGFYFRATPLKIYLPLLKSLAQQRIPVLYFHPHELFNYLPEIATPWLRKKIKYYGVKNSLKKLEDLLKEFNFISIEKYLSDNRCSN